MIKKILNYSKWGLLFIYVGILFILTIPFLSFNLIFKNDFVWLDKWFEKGIIMYLKTPLRPTSKIEYKVGDKLYSKMKCGTTINKGDIFIITLILNDGGFDHLSKNDKDKFNTYWVSKIELDLFFEPFVDRRKRIINNV